MCKLKKCAVSFVLVLLLSFGSLVPCFADDLGEMGFTVSFYPYTSTPQLGTGIYVPTDSLRNVNPDVTLSAGAPIRICFATVSQYLFTSDKTLYFSVYPTVGWNNADPSTFMDDTAVTSDTSVMASELPVFQYGRGYSSGSYAYDAPVTRLVISSGVNSGNYQLVAAPVYRVTLPAENSSGQPFQQFSCVYPEGFWESNINGQLRYFVKCFTFVDTADPAILGKIDEILAKLESIDSGIDTTNDKLTNISMNLNNVLTACNRIITELEAINADTDTIITALDTLTELSRSQLTQLENISKSVDAIYYFLTQALADESGKLDDEVAGAVDQIQDQSTAEDFYRESMTGHFEALDMGNFSLDSISFPLRWVGTLFSNIWAAFGDYTIIFTYPLFLGVALVVIGRLSKTGGGNSSRNTEHKGGEGGA